MEGDLPVVLQCAGLRPGHRGRRGRRGRGPPAGHRVGESGRAAGPGPQGPARPHKVSGDASRARP